MLPNFIGLATVRFIIASTLSISLFVSISLSQSTALGQQPDVKNSPSCGPKSGFNMDIEATGFSPNTNVGWKLVSSFNETPLSGYFQTENTGGISDTTFTDDIKTSHYKMYFDEDANNDGRFDQSSPTHPYADLEISC
jgi:hypothetical protein